MSKQIVETPPIALIFDKRGCQWNSKERLLVKEWLHEKEPIKYLHLVARWHLGEGATAEDAQDVWIDFYIKRLDSVIGVYDPAKKLRFWDYMLFCFKRFCHPEGEQIRKRRNSEVALGGEKDGEYIELQLIAQGQNHEDDLAQKEDSDILQTCINQLPPRYRLIIASYYLEEMTIQEIAVRFRISENTVKVRLYRGRQQLKILFEKEVGYYEQANN